MLRRALFAALLAPALVAPTLVALPAMAQTTPTRVRGTIQSLDGNVLTVATREGDTAKITLAPNYAVAAVIPATLADVKKGAFVGIAAVGPKDRMRALEVLIFPEAMRGSGEGHYPWDLQPESTMTNATIESEVAGASGRDLTVVAKGETLKVAVPPDAPIVTFESGSPAMLTPGAKVFVGAQKAADGSLTAARVNVGKDGLTPPM
jgi:hypothetical protein